jgi:hypothetical protein
MQCQYLNTVGMQCPETIWDYSHIFHGNTKFCDKHVCQFPLCEMSVVRSKGIRYCEKHVNVNYCRSPIRVGVQCWTRCCGETPIDGTNYCSKHKCVLCDEPNYGDVYCSKHRCSERYCSNKKMDNQQLCQKCYERYSALKCNYCDNNGVKCTELSRSARSKLGEHVKHESDYCDRHTCCYDDNYHGEYCDNKVCDDTSKYCEEHCTKCSFSGCKKYTDMDTCEEHKCSKCYECYVVTEPIKLCEKHKVEYEFQLHEFDE